MNPSTPAGRFRVAALYRFRRVDDPTSLRASLAERCRALDIRGTLLVAAEGVNGTVAGTPEAIEALTAHLEELFPGLTAKFSEASAMPFHRMKVRLKREIVTMGVDGVDPVRGAGTYVAPADWNALAADSGTLLIDARNDYEVALGTFAGALDPKTKSFREFPAWAAGRLDELRGRKIAMFCTGGIRCEKATAYLRSLGLDEVYHLQGGILKYLEDVPAEESLWRGECFVFDERVSVTHGLAEGEAQLCRACRRPLTPGDLRSPHYVEGVSCGHCRDQRSEDDRARYAERHRQVKLAEARGDRRHIGR